jgi:glycine dehydrogenase
MTAMYGIWHQATGLT